MMLIQAAWQTPRISDHCFKAPLGAHDCFHQLKTVIGNVDLDSLRVQAEDKARASAGRRIEALGPLKNGSASGNRERLASTIFGLLTSSRYRRGSIDYVRMAERRIHLQISRAILRDEPIEFLLEFFAFKMRNKLRTFSRDGTEVDLSEAATLLRLHEIASAVKELYPPGALMKVATDGTKFCGALETAPETARAYARNLDALAQALGVHRNVQFFDEADSFADDHAASTHHWYMRLRKEYARSSDTPLAETVVRFRNSMHFMLPLAADIPIDVVSRAFSKQIGDAQLRVLNPDAYHLRKDVECRALDATLRYIAVKKAAPRALQGIAPRAVLCCAHPRPGYLGLYVAGRGNTLFPHHSQGVFPGYGDNASLDSIRMGYAADIRRDPNCGSHLVGIVLPRLVYRFSNGVHPFAFVSSSSPARTPFAML